MSLQSKRSDADSPETELTQPNAQELVEMSDTGTVYSTVTAFTRPLQALAVQRQGIFAKQQSISVDTAFARALFTRGSMQPSDSERSALETYSEPMTEAYACKLCFKQYAT